MTSPHRASSKGLPLLRFLEAGGFRFGVFTKRRIDSLKQARHDKLSKATNYLEATRDLFGLNRIRSLKRLLVISLSFFLISCGPTLGTRSQTEVLPVITVPGAPLPSALRLGLGVAIEQPSIDLGAGESFVTFVRIRNITLNILGVSDTEISDDGAVDSFDFLTGLTVTLRADFDGQTQEILVATLPDGDVQFGSAARTLSLTVVSSQTDVLDYILAPGGYEVVLGLEGQFPADNVLLSGTIRYRVGLGLSL